VINRFAPLVEVSELMEERLIGAGITDKYEFLERMEGAEEILAMESDMEVGLLRMLERFLHLYDFKCRRIAELKSADSGFIQELIRHGIRTSGDYLVVCKVQNVYGIAKRFSVDEEKVHRVVGLCDLMRLPGVKDIRAALYYDCRYRGLSDFVKRTPEEMRDKIEQFVTKNKIGKSVPFLKELSTQIAVAKALPHLEILQGYTK